MRQVDGAGIEVDQSHGDSLTFQGRELVEIDPAELEAIDESVRLGTTQGEGEVLGIEQRDLCLEERDFVAVGGRESVTVSSGFEPRSEGTAEWGTEKCSSMLMFDFAVVRVGISRRTNSIPIAESGSSINVQPC